MNKKKIRNLIISLVTFILLASYSCKLVKGNKSALKVINNHSKTSSHIENIVAHRGFSGIYHDNSYNSVLHALESPCVDFIEIDIRITKDKQIILHHDAFINMQNLVIKIEDLVLDNLDDNLVVDNFSTYNVSELLYNDSLFLVNRYLEKIKDHEQIIKLEDFINWYSFDKKLIIDIKNQEKTDEEFMSKINNLLENHQYDVYLQSSNYSFLETMMNLYPNYKYLYIIDSKKDLNNKNNNFSGYTIKYSLLENLEVEEDKIYLIYTINSNKKYYNLLNNPNYCDNMYVVTDNPDYICAISEEKKLRK